MTHELAPGVQGVLERSVEEQHCTRRGDRDILSTPNLVLFVEEAAIQALAPHLTEDQSSVGSNIQLAHVAPTLRGQRVRATVTVTEVDRRRVSFDVRIEDDVEVIGHGTHERFVIDVPSFAKRLTQKAGAFNNS